MTRNLCIVTTIEAGPEDAEAFGPFTSEALANRFVQEYEEQGVRPCGPLMVVELWPVREGLKSIREAKKENERYDNDG